MKVYVLIGMASAISLVACKKQQSSTIKSDFATQSSSGLGSTKSSVHGTILSRTQHHDLVAAVQSDMFSTMGESDTMFALSIPVENNGTVDGSPEPESLFWTDTSDETGDETGTSDATGSIGSSEASSELASPPILGGDEPEPNPESLVERKNPPETEYMKKCRQAGVPIPPAWTSGKWKRVARLEKGRIFALDPNLETVLYSYEDPKVKGVCAALPRMTSSGIIAALGIICQGANGNACFWDNKERVRVENQPTIRDPDLIRPELIGDGDILNENCTSCHRGSNVFIIHRDTDMKKLPNKDFEGEYQPISDQGWKNRVEGWFDAAGNELAPDCQSCHDADQALGKLDMAYCGTVMMPSIQNTSWQFNAADWKWELTDILNGKEPPMPPRKHKKYDDDIAWIKAQCKANVDNWNRTAPESEKMYWTWGDTPPPLPPRPVTAPTAPTAPTTELGPDVPPSTGDASGDASNPFAP